MANTNGNGKWIYWLVGSLFTIMLAILGFGGKGIVANNEHSLTRDECLNQRITSNETRIVRLEECQKAVEGNLQDIKQQNEKINTKLDKILYKVEYQ